MKTRAVLVYLSTSGNTKQLADLLSKRMSLWADVVLLPIERAERSPELISEASVIGFGGPVFQLGLAERVMKFVESNARSSRTSGKQFFLFCTYVGISSGLAFLAPGRLLSRAGHPLPGALKIKTSHFYHKTAGFPYDEAKSLIGNFADELRMRLRERPDQGKLLDSLDYQGRLVKVLHRIIPSVSNRRVSWLPRRDAGDADHTGSCAPSVAFQSRAPNLCSNGINASSATDA
ncbi:MAG TPA: hypothetical protein VMW87_12260 [Spirochaetia bacterium]|nr:hypothetical protein [Spirochaetia bacterium]